MSFFSAAAIGLTGSTVCCLWEGPLSDFCFRKPPVCNRPKLLHFVARGAIRTLHYIPIMAEPKDVRVLMPLTRGISVTRRAKPAKSAREGAKSPHSQFTPASMNGSAASIAIAPFFASSHNRRRLAPARSALVLAHGTAFAPPAPNRWQPTPSAPSPRITPAPSVSPCNPCRALASLAAIFPPENRGVT